MELIATSSSFVGAKAVLSRRDWSYYWELDLSDVVGILWRK